MEKEDNYSENFSGLPDYSLDPPPHHHHQQHQLKPRMVVGENSSGDHDHNNNGMIDYMLQHHQQQQQQQISFADVMQFADFGPKLGLNQTKIAEEDQTGIDPSSYFLRFPVLNDKFENQQALMVQNEEKGSRELNDDDARVSELRFLGDDDENDVIQNYNSNDSPAARVVKNKRKRPRTVKTNEEVESQRMTHIAVERNRRKQMNEHLRVLRSLMPGSYVQRGDQASIIGGAIEFVRELEQLLQCLESQKRRRLYGEAPPPPPPPSMVNPQTFQNDQMLETGLREETSENKSCLADVEVKLLGFDAMIKILSRRRPGQLIKTIAALEDLQLTILHTNITTIEQTVLYSFNVKVGSESTRFTAEDIASSVQQIFSFIHANSSM